MNAPLAAMPACADPAAAPQCTVLCVDDEPNILSSLRRLFRPQGYRMLTAESAIDALALLEREHVDVVISDMRMPQMDGAQFLAHVRERWPDAVRLLLTGYADMERTVAAINSGEILRYLSKPWNDVDVMLTVRQALERKSLEREKLRLEALTRRQNAQLKVTNDTLEAKVAERTAALAAANAKLEASFVTSIKMFSSMIEMRGGGLAGHSRRTADLARRIAQQMGLGGAETQNVFLAALLHDVGKIGFSDVLLARPVNALAGEHLVQYRKHPARGAQALTALAELAPAAAIVRAHHERFDGSGFPDGLAAGEIPLGARILAVANDYDDLQTGVLAQPTLTAPAAVAAIEKARGHRYDPAVVAALVAVLAGGQADGAGEATVNSSHLEPGMVLARDAVAADGALLLAADYVLDERLIRQLRQYEQTEGTTLVFRVKTQREG